VPLHTHLEKQDVHFTLFAFKWMNCLLMRELPLALVTRMWDTYLSEPEGTSSAELTLPPSPCVMKASHAVRQVSARSTSMCARHS
jgi:hypothetical protein